MLSILIPAYNEADILESSALKVHEYLAARSLEHEVIVTSNGSTERRPVNFVATLRRERGGWILANVH